MVFQYYFCLWFSKTDQKLKVTLKYIQGSTRVRISHTPSRKKNLSLNKSIIKIYENLFFLISSIFFFYFFMKWEVFKISAFTGLSSPHHPVMTSASLHMQNTCVTKNFHPRKLPNLDLQYINQKNFYLLFTIFLLHFFSYYSPQKHEKFSRICLQVLHIFKGELYGMSIIVSKKKVEWHKDFLGFFLGVQTVNLQNYYAPQEDSMQIFLRWPVMHFFHRA